MLVRYGGTYYRVHICRLKIIELQNRNILVEIPEGNTELEESDPKMNRGENEHNGIQREDSEGNTELEESDPKMNRGENEHKASKGKTVKEILNKKVVPAQ